jgi:hypothetical protein
MKRLRFIHWFLIASIFNAGKELATYATTQDPTYSLDTTALIIPLLVTPFSIKGN